MSPGSALRSKVINVNLERRHFLFGQTCEDPTLPMHLHKYPLNANTSGVFGFIWLGFWQECIYAPHSLFVLLWAYSCLFSLSHRCFPSSHANSCPVSRTPAGMRTTLGTCLQIHTGQTCTRTTRSAFARCSSSWGTLFRNTWSIATEKPTACAACRTFISSANQSVARRTCTTDSGCTPMSSSPLSRSHTGGPAKGLVSKESRSLQCWKHKHKHLWCKM